LADPEIADYAEYPILRGEELGHYELRAFVIMPNHVHILIEPHKPLAKITGAIKGVAARDGNATLGRTGKPFWQDESFDHWIRDSAEFERVRAYIKWNPVKAKLATRPEDWKWSSAWPGRNRTAQPRVAVPLGGIETAQPRVAVPLGGIETAQPGAAVPLGRNRNRTAKSGRATGSEN
jgi:REP element-mobilizing transposase RayT